MLIEKELVASAARGSSSNSGTVVTRSTASQRSPDFHPDARLYLSVTAASGTTPTLDVVIYKRLANGQLVYLGQFTQATAVAGLTLLLTHCPEEIQVNWTIGGGTPSFTFSVHVDRTPW